MKSEDHLPGIELFPYFVINSLELTDLVLTFVSFLLFLDIFFPPEIHLQMTKLGEIKSKIFELFKVFQKAV